MLHYNGRKLFLSVGDVEKRYNVVAKPWPVKLPRFVLCIYGLRISAYPNK